MVIDASNLLKKHSGIVVDCMHRWRDLVCICEPPAMVGSGKLSCPAPASVGFSWLEVRALCVQIQNLRY